jgi:hypothetical protein
LATTDGETVTVRAEAGAVGVAIGHASTSILVLVESETGRSAGRLVGGSGFRVWLAPRPPQLLSATLLTPDVDLADILTSTVEAALAEDEEAAITLSVELPTTSQPMGLAIAGTADGPRFRLATDGEERAGRVAESSLIELVKELVGAVPDQSRPR